MSFELIVTLCMFGSLVLSIMLGISLSYALGFIAVVTGTILWGSGAMMSVLTPVFSYMWMILLSAVPLFVFIGVALAYSKIATDMYETFYLWSGTLRGGLAVGSCGFAAILSAMTGNCSASTVTAGLVGMPPMREKGYDEKIMFGTIGSAGTLGILIPPSLSLIIIGMLTNQSVGKLFAGGLAAGLFILLCFIAYILIISYLKPDLCPAMIEPASWKQKLASLRLIAIPLLIMTTVLGTIFFGIATPTEASSVGALSVAGAVMLRREFTWSFVQNVTYDTAKITGMVMWIMFGAGAFVSIYGAAGGVYFVQSMITGLDLNPLLLIIGMQLIVLILGMFLDAMGITLLCLPLFFPVVTSLGYDPLWFSILFNINLCIGYISPPFGYNLFYLKSIQPDSSMSTIYAATVPFIGIMLACEALMFIFPWIITFLPNYLIQ